MADPHQAMEARLIEMSPARMSKIEAAIRVVLAFNQALNRRDVAALAGLMSADIVLEHREPAPDGAVYTGLEEVVQFWEGFFHAWPQAHVHIEEIFSGGDRCVMRWKTTWEEPGGEEGYVRGVDIFRVKDGLIQEQLSYAKA